MSVNGNSMFNPRDTFGKKIIKIGEQRPEVMVLTADLAYTCCVIGFAEAFPERFINVGIAEQNMVGMSAGLAFEGKLPWITTIASFITMRCFEQIRTDLCYNKLHVVLVSVMAGISGAPLGSTHYATEDIGAFRSLANMTILQPADQWEVEQVMDAALEVDHPVYIRLGSGIEPNLSIDRNRFKIGHAYTLREGRDAYLISSGYMVHKALEAAEKLKAYGISVGVQDHPSIKPLDRESILAAAENSRLVVTLEEHNVFGGLGSAVAEVMAESRQTSLLIRMGIPDLYVGVGSREDLLSKHGLGVAAIVECVKNGLK